LLPPPEIDRAYIRCGRRSFHQALDIPLRW
jgi:hypothetical protein